MRTRTIVGIGIAVGGLLLCGGAQAQIQSQDEPASSVGSMHGIIGARSSALGEATATAMGDPGAWNSNPATVAGLGGVGMHSMIGHRSVSPYGFATDWVGAGAWLATPVANVALHYANQDLGEFWSTFSTGDDPTRYHWYNETITLSVARDLSVLPIALGVSVKWMREHTSVAQFDPSELMAVEASGVYVDIGAMGSLGGLLAGDGMRDTIRIGAAIQDVGGRLVYQEVGQSSEIAQWLRLGAGYTISIGDSAAATFRATINGEYQRLLNGNSQQGKEYGGIGVEATALELVSLRVGARFFPHERLHLTDEDPWLTFGVGVDLPLRRIGADLPLTVGIDYAKLPEQPSSDSRTDQLLELRIGYTGNVFGR